MGVVKADEYLYSYNDCMFVFFLKPTCLKKRPHPPGREIYRKYKYSIFEVDGEDHKVVNNNNN